MMSLILITCFTCNQLNDGIKNGSYLSGKEWFLPSCSGFKHPGMSHLFIYADLFGRVGFLPT